MEHNSALQVIKILFFISLVDAALLDSHWKQQKVSYNRTNLKGEVGKIYKKYNNILIYKLYFTIYFVFILIYFNTYYIGNTIIK